MPNKMECECPVCKKPGKAWPTREKHNGLVSIQMNVVCLECKVFWTPDLGWKPIPKKLRSRFIHEISEST